MAIKLLAVGDMHLGRQPSRLPSQLGDQLSRLTPIATWQRLVEEAIAQEVDVVALAGDLVDQEDNFFEAFRPLEEGLNRLLTAQIDVVAITGNHDVQVLPRLAKQLSGLNLLGSQGRWETYRLDKAGESLTLHAWSFPQKVVRNNPVKGHHFERQGGVELGLLHCDLDQPQSVYAPVSSQDLQASGLDGWLLGHIHKPSTLSPEAPVGYLGSICGLSVKENGPRGPWLLTIEHGAVQEIEQWCIAPIHWEHLKIDVTGLNTSAELDDRLMTHLKAVDQSLSTHRQPPDVVGVRLSLVGETSHGRAFQSTLLDRRDDNFAVGQMGHIILESVQDETRAPIDLNHWALQSNHAGRLAKNILILEAGPDEPGHQALIDQARSQLAPVAGDERWQPLEPESLSDAEVLSYLLTSGHRLLRQLVAQLDDAGP